MILNRIHVKNRLGLGRLEIYFLRLLSPTHIFSYITPILCKMKVRDAHCTCLSLVLTALVLKDPESLKSSASQKWISLQDYPI